MMKNIMYESRVIAVFCVLVGVIVLPQELSPRTIEGSHLSAASLDGKLYISFLKSSDRFDENNPFVVQGVSFDDAEPNMIISHTKGQIISLKAQNNLHSALLYKGTINNYRYKSDLSSKTLIKTTRFYSNFKSRKYDFSINNGTLHTCLVSDKKIKISASENDWSIKDQKNSYYKCKSLMSGSDMYLALSKESAIDI